MPDKRWSGRRRVARFPAALLSLPGFGGLTSASHETSSCRLTCPDGHHHTLRPAGPEERR
ncbi:hypothetical protein C2C67_25260 [Escherichia coli]|nr:hypothetical protein [Escherichia coli]EFO3748740.1 hypothetical protein [Escherichia coli]